MELFLSQFYHQRLCAALRHPLPPGAAGVWECYAAVLQRVRQAVLSLAAGAGGFLPAAGETGPGPPAVAGAALCLEPLAGRGGGGNGNGTGPVTDRNRKRNRTGD